MSGYKKVTLTGFYLKTAWNSWNIIFKIEFNFLPKILVFNEQREKEVKHWMWHRMSKFCIIVVDDSIFCG